MVWSKKNFVNYGNILLSAKMLIEMREIECAYFAMKTSVLTDLRHNQVNFNYFFYYFYMNSWLFIFFYNKNKRNKTYVHLCRILIKKTWDKIVFVFFWRRSNQHSFHYILMSYLFLVWEVLRECNLV